MNRKKSGNIHWLAVLLAYSSLFLLGLGDNLRGPLYPEVLQGLKLDDIHGSYLWASASFFAFLGAVVAHLLIRQVGLLGSLQVSLFLMCSGQAGMALSENLTMALTSSCLFGLSLGFLGVSQNLLVLRSGPPELISRLQAGLHSNYALSSLLAPLILTLIYVYAPGWRSGYAGGAVFTGLGFIALWWVPRDGVDHLHQVGEAKPTGSFHQPWRRHFYAFYFALSLAFYVVTEIMVSSRLALFFRREAGMDFNQASLATTGFFLSLFFGRFLLIFWRPSWALKKQLLVSLSTTLIFLLLGLFYYPLALLATGLTMAPFFPLSMTYMGEVFGSQVNLATSWAMALDGFLVVLMHLLVGAFSEQQGITNALLMGPVALVLAITFLAFDQKVWRTR